MRENIVGTIIILTLIPYVIACIIVSCLDWYTERKYGPLFKRVLQFVRLQQQKLKSRVSSCSYLECHETFSWANTITYTILQIVYSSLNHSTCAGKKLNI